MGKDDYRGIEDFEDLVYALNVSCSFKIVCSDYPEKCGSCKFNAKKTSYYQPKKQEG